MGLSSSSKLDYGSCIVSTGKNASKKIGVLIRFLKFFLRCKFIFLSLPRGLCQIME